ncbi:hypothetical protein [Pelagicoccus sp. SDUM812005]|uniref:hypothetical protein n=1 Tax=Pelagicoccus sp. SDUM812005 TaxID=3041257 RepID=UPI00280E8EC6|nr:hypothetical protein [Pelagicoccus sp. SDUM812005]MDQ8182748.1 hypothetical protein [Pelagicoccus sp. SDUM812005]
MFRFLGLLLLWVLACCGALRAEPGLFLEVERWRIERIMEMGYSMDPGTEAEIEALAAVFPESPVPGVLEAGYLYWMQNYQAWDEELKTEFEQRSEEALERAKEYLKERPEDPDARFAVAMVELMQVIYYVDHHRWWPAFWKSRSSLKTMRKLLAEYPDYHDAKLPLGMQHCYLSRTPAYLKPLAFLMRFKGDWETGLLYMKEAGEGGLFCKVDAGYYLAAIRMELEGDAQASRDEMAKLAERFPGNLKFAAMLAELERGLGKQAVAKAGALAVLADERAAAFAGIRGRTLVTLLWSSLGDGDFEQALEAAEALRLLAAEHEGFDYDLAWVDFVEAEALWGLGKRDAAREGWERVEGGSHEAAAAAARKRLSQEAEQ